MYYFEVVRYNIFLFAYGALCPIVIFQLILVLFRYIIGQVNLFLSQHPLTSTYF